MISVWEHGGGMTNSGLATVVCNLHGERMVPSFVPQGGPLANGNHARYDVDDCVVVTATRGSGREEVKVERHTDTGVTVIASYANGEWQWPENEVDPTSDAWPYKRAMAAAIDKTFCYHCRHAHFALEG